MEVGPPGQERSRQREIKRDSDRAQPAPLKAISTHFTPKHPTSTSSTTSTARGGAVLEAARQGSGALGLCSWTADPRRQRRCLELRDQRHRGRPRRRPRPGPSAGRHALHGRRRRDGRRDRGGHRSTDRDPDSARDHRRHHLRNPLGVTHRHAWRAVPLRRALVTRDWCGRRVDIESAARNSEKGAAGHVEKAAAVGRRDGRRAVGVGQSVGSKVCLDRPRLSLDPRGSRDGGVRRARARGARRDADDGQVGRDLCEAREHACERAVLSQARAACSERGAHQGDARVLFGVGHGNLLCQRCADHV
eukprot:2130876-Rhodomonas_salina.2